MGQHRTRKTLHGLSIQGNRELLPVEFRHTVAVERPDSRAITALWYDHQTQEMVVYFPNTRTLWKYYGVTPQRFGLLATAHSLGRYYNEHVRNMYTTRKIYDPHEQKEPVVQGQP